MFSFFDPANIKYNSQKGGAILENVSPLTDISLVANIDRENARGYAIDAVNQYFENVGIGGALQDSGIFIID